MLGFAYVQNSILYCVFEQQNRENDEKQKNKYGRRAHSMVSIVPFYVFEFFFDSCFRPYITTGGKTHTFPMKWRKSPVHTFISKGRKTAAAMLKCMNVFIMYNITGKIQLKMNL